MFALMMHTHVSIHMSAHRSPRIQPTLVCTSDSSRSKAPMSATTDMCVDQHVYTHVYTHVYQHSSRHIRTPVCTYAETCTQSIWPPKAYTQVCTHVHHTCLPACVHKMSTHMFMCMSTRMFVHMCMHRSTHISTHMSAHRTTQHSSIPQCTSSRGRSKTQTRWELRMDMCVEKNLSMAHANACVEIACRPACTPVLTHTNVRHTSVQHTCPQSG